MDDFSPVLIWKMIIKREIAETMASLQNGYVNVWCDSSFECIYSNILNKGLFLECFNKSRRIVISFGNENSPNRFLVFGELQRDGDASILIPWYWPYEKAYGWYGFS